MQDIFVRRRLNELSGMTVYSQYSNLTPVSFLSANQWVDLLSLSNSRNFIATAYELVVNSSGSDLSQVQMRIIGGANGSTLDKIFPHGDSVEVLSGVTQHLKFGIRVPEKSDIKIQVRGVFSTGAPTAILNFLSVVFNPPLSN